LWYRLKQHIDNYTGSDPETNDFEEDEEEEEDAPKEQYVENAFKLLRLLACMVIKKSPVLRHISIESPGDCPRLQSDQYEFCSRSLPAGK